MNSAPPVDPKQPIDIKEHQQLPEPSVGATIKPDAPGLVFTTSIILLIAAQR